MSAHKLREKLANIFFAKVKSVLRQFMDLFCSNFQKNRLTDFQKCRVSLIRSALETSDPGASNGGPNVEI